VSRFPFDAALGALEERVGGVPELFVILGSGLSGLADGMPEAISISFQEIPGFPDVGVAGHAGRLISGVMEGRRVLLQAGRFHLYEGHPAATVVAPIRLAAALGAPAVIVTNAAGGIRRDLGPGSLMLLDDHLNLMFRNPLVGRAQEGESRFADLSSPYDPGLQEAALGVADTLGILLTRGVYAGVLGPSYETPAEIRFLEKAGADAVGMSTVPEAVTAAALGLRVLGLSLITNRAAGLGASRLDHGEVLEVGRRTEERMERLIRGFIRGLPQ
jgi:purine-nucleoside phosphorylase